MYFYRLLPDASSVKQISGDALSTTQLPNPRDTPEEYEAYKKTIREQEAPIITMAAVKHLAEVFDAWESGSEERIGRKAVLTDLKGRTFEISCQLGEVTDAFGANQPPTEVFRSKLIAHYGLPGGEINGHVSNATHNYMPLSVAYVPAMRHSDTKEVLRTEELWYDTEDWTSARFRNEFHASIDDWETYSPLLCRVKETLRRVDLTRIRKIVIFAGGTMQLTSGQRVIFNQHGLVALLARFIEEQTGQDVKLFAQDPLYGEQDKALLESECFSVLDDPRGVLEVDESCFVVEIGHFMLQRVVADVARPAGMIWANRHGGEDLHHFATGRTKKMATEYNAVELPQDRKVSAGGLWLYTRKDLGKV